MVAPLVRLYRGPGIKPYASVPRIDWSHPLASKLRSYNYDTGSGVVIDLVRGAQSVIVTNTTRTTVGTSVLGKGFNYPNATNGDGVVMPLGVKSSFAPPFSFAVGYLPTSATAGGQPAVCFTNTGTNSAFIFECNNGTPFFQSRWAGMGATDTLSNAVAFAPNIYHTSAVVLPTTAGGTLYSDGKSDNAISGDASSSFSNLQLVFNGFYPNNVGGGALCGPCPYVAMWDRTLSAAEVSQLHNDPYCFLIYPEDEMFAALVGAAASATPSLGWQKPLSPAPPAVIRSQGFISFVPFNTVQPSNSRNRLDWQQPLASAPNPPTTWPGFSFEPFNTPQVSAVITAIGWQPQLSSSPKPISASPGQWQLIVPPPFVVALGWQPPFSAAPPIGRVPTSFAYVPFDTAQTQPVTLTYGWQSALSNAPPILRAPAGFAFVPFDTPQVVAQIVSYGWLSALSIAPAVARAPSIYSYAPFGPVPQTVTFAWQPPLYAAPPRQMAAFPALDLVPAWAAATTPIISLAWLQPLATAAARPPSFQPVAFVPFNTTQVPLAGIAGMAWFYPLSAAPRVLYSPRGPYAGWAPSPLSTTPPPTPSPLPHNLHYHVTFGKLKSF